MIARMKTASALAPNTPIPVMDTVRIQQDLTSIGWHVLRGAIPSGTITGLRGAMARAVEETAQTMFRNGQVSDPLHGVDPDERLIRLYAECPPTFSHSWRRIIAGPEVFAAWQVPALQTAMRALLGDHLYASQVWNGRPRTPGQSIQTVGWHQDAPYLPGYRPGIDRAITAWMPLVPVDADSGCLAVASASHRHGLMEIVRNTTNGLIGVADEAITRFETVAVAMAPGDVLLFDDLTCHRALENRSSRIRWSLDIRFAAGTNAGLLANEAASGLRGSGYHCRLPDGRAGRYDDWIGTYRYPEEF
jgi:phytanoyl-CoA hydroxylase